MTDEKPTILVVDDDIAVADTLAALLTQAGYLAQTAHSAELGRQAMKRRPFDLVITDLRMPGDDGMTLLRELREDSDGPPVVMLTAHGTVDTAVEAMKLGAADFMRKPFDREEILFVVDKALRAEPPPQSAPAPASPDTKTSERAMIGSSDAMQRLQTAIDRAASASSTVLVRGESGTGKELIARAIHERSKRAGGPFVRVHSAALPDTLLESELFGHEKGAFTGATSQKPGRVELADGGTLFLDEIGDISASAQVKLLRVLQEREFERVGGTETLKSDVRFVAATHRDLEKMVREGEFREDLYYRLNVLRIDSMPLREHAEDIPELVESFVVRLAEENGRPRPTVTEDAIAALSAYEWPGNVRQLQNIAERLVVCHDGPTITVDAVNAELSRERGLNGEPTSPVSSPGESLDDTVRRAEEAAIRDALQRCGGNRTQAARVLGISRRSLYYKLEEFEIE